MKDKNQDYLNEEIERGILNLETLDPTSEEYAKAVESLAKLYKLRIEENKNDAELGEKVETRLKEHEKSERELDIKSRQVDNEVIFHDQDDQIKKDQMRNQTIDRWVNVGLQVGLTMLGIIAYDCWYRRGLKFEETGTVTSGMTRNIISRMLPSKK